VRDSVGDPNFPIWLIADSQPENWQGKLLTPLDPRHPTRHNIWTAILDYLQDSLYRDSKRRLDTSQLYIRNAVTDPESKPANTSVEWSAELNENIAVLRGTLAKFKPKIVLTFGSFAFEFLRRALDEKPAHPYIKWDTRQLGTEFKERLDNYNKAKINVLPLLHISIARGKFLESHKYFVGEETNDYPNYFEFVGEKLAELFLEKLISERIWINNT